MRFLFATGRVHTPDRVGGAMASAHSLLSLIQAEGHQCEVVAQIRPGPRSQCLRLARRLAGRRRWSAWADRRNGYVTYRGLSWTLRDLLLERIEAFTPDVVITQLTGSREIIDAARSRGVPAILLVVDALFQHDGDQLRRTGALVVSNSYFISEWMRQRFAVESPVVYSPVDLERYRTTRHDPSLITLINPIQLKGVDLAIEIAARLPHRRFRFQEAWPLSAAEMRALRDRLAAVPNVALDRSVTDMRSVYASTALLIVPSQVEEASPRVILEAQVNSIPAVARGVGGIPELVGAGGIVMAASDGAGEWAEAVERVLSDRPLYDTLAERARVNAARPEFDARSLVRRFIAMAGEHAAGHRASAP
jgi:glycosyltransferase involved in cell wall biosynthesis